MTRYVLAAGRPILLRPDGAVQLGWDPRRAVLVHPPAGMSQAQLTDVLRTMQAGAARDELLTAAGAFDDTDAVDALIGALLGSGMLTVLPTAPLGRPGRHPSGCTVADRCRNC
ncbi:cyclodehydratase [Mycolicibacterium fortuitum]|uniref:Cyclodehydratase n=1 Tax=Mycolicibacterium fortuitum TaxID=1766 RepID=A0A378U6U4_MYCFO|nr:cyclodehydratase [Mycolicibacterium fortuitum]